MKGDPNRAAGLLHRRYALTLAAVAALLLLDQALLQPWLLGLATDATVINVAGRQRMLSQRLAKAALALDAAEDEGGRRRYLDELDRVRRAWSDAHGRLRHGRNGPVIRAAFDDLEPSFRRMSGAAEGIVLGRPIEGNLAVLLADEADYLGRMDRIVGLYEREARAHVDRLRRAGWAVTALTLAALGGLGLFVLGPADRLIRRQMVELRSARDELEDRVAERSRELEREAGERALAEERHRALLEQLGHAARTNTVGEMASGLAHELNQPLGAIANYAEGCLVALDGPSPGLGEVRSALEKVLATTLRAGEVLRRIRRFVTRRPASVEPFDPNRVVREVEEFLRDEARRRGVALRIDLAPELPSLRGDPVQIQQVLINLVRNAFDATEAAGPEVSEPIVLVQTRTDEFGGVEFGVTDRGEGIPADRLARVFDPFFSTRAEGMGMGLAISRTIVEAHRGRIAVDSEPGVRTTFRFSLPIDGGGDDAGSDGLCGGR